jgi:hypothetical protein
MQQDVEGGQEKISSRHPLAALPFGAILTFVGVRRRRGPRDTGRRPPIRPAVQAVVTKRPGPRGSRRTLDTQPEQRK